MDFATAVRTCFQKYATFSGRAARPEYWWFALFNVLGSIAAGILDGLFANPGDTGGPIGALFSLALLLPSLAVAVRRMHDIGRSGWWVLIILIPLIGWIILIYWFVQPGTPGRNDYGPPPGGHAEPEPHWDEPLSQSSIPRVDKDD